MFNCSNCKYNYINTNTINNLSFDNFKLLFENIKNCLQCKNILVQLKCTLCKNICYCTNNTIICYHCIYLLNNSKIFNN